PGPDTILGFSTTTVGAAQIEDNLSSNFSETGNWTSQPGGVLGHNDSYSGGPSYYPNDVATWTFTGLTPNSWFNVAASWPTNNYAYSSPFSVLDGGQLISTQTIDQRNAPADFSDNGAMWKNLGLFYVTGGTLTVQLSHVGYYTPAVL